MFFHKLCNILDLNTYSRVWSIRRVPQITGFRCRALITHKGRSHFWSKQPKVFRQQNADYAPC